MRHASAGAASRRARPLRLSTMARGGATPCSSQIVRVPVLAPSASGENQSGEREARTTTPAGSAWLAPSRASGAALRGTRASTGWVRLRPGIFPWSRSGTGPGPRLQDGVAARLLQAGQQVERGGTNRGGPKARPKAGRGQSGEDRHDGQPETQLDQGDTPASVPRVHGGDSVAPGVCGEPRKTALICTVSRCPARFRRVYSRPCQCRIWIRASSRT